MEGVRFIAALACGGAALVESELRPPSTLVPKLLLFCTDLKAPAALRAKPKRR